MIDMGRHIPAIIATLLIILSMSPMVQATDTDGDGYDDSVDAFPNDPCANSDTDNDGLPDEVSSGCTSNGIIAHTSFEDPLNGSIYIDTGDSSVDRYLWNNVGESHVSHNVTNGSEMGFQLYYESTGSNGLTDGDFFGVVDYTGTVGSFIDGDKGYEMSDVDGIATLEFDAVDADSVEFDLYVQQKLQSGQHANWETADKIVIWFDGANSEIEILNTTGDDIDTAHTSLLGTWTKYVVDLTGAGAGSLKFMLQSNAATEAIYVDNITFTGGTVLVEDYDDDNDGWTDSDEANCGTDPLDGASVPSDSDGNGICDIEEGGDTDGDGIPDLSDSDDDNDGVSDKVEEDAGTDSFSSADKPFAGVTLPVLDVKLQEWDLITIGIGGPSALYLAFTFLSRNRRTEEFEQLIHEAQTELELRAISDKYERAMQMRLIGTHQGLRLERIRSKRENILEYEMVEQHNSEVENQPKQVVPLSNEEE